MEVSRITPSDHTYSKTILNYCCNHCNREFMYNFGLYNHSEHHFGKKDIECSKCERTFYTKTDLHCHRVISHGKKTRLYCNMCDLYWITEDMYVEHMRTHAGERWLYNCVECDRKYKTIAKFRVHRALHFERRVQGSCQVCLKIFVNLRILIGHRCSEGGINSKQAVVSVASLKNTCEKSVNLIDMKRMQNRDDIIRTEKVVPKIKANKTTVSKPKLRLKNMKSKNVINQHVQKTFIKNKCFRKKHLKMGNEGFRAHQKSKEHGPSEKTKKHLLPKIIKCDECGETYSSVTLLRNHMKDSTCFGKAGSFGCSSCGKHYSVWGGLVSHRKIGVCGTKLPQCEVCNRIFNSKGEIRRHLKSSKMCCTYPARMSRQHECLNCGRKFGYVRSRDEHQERCKVFKTRSYECKICNRTIRSQADFKVHMISHTKEKAHECVKCSEKFLYKNYLYNHYRQNDECGKGVDFPKLSYDPQELMCEFCGKRGFAGRSIYNNHIRSRHPGQDSLVCANCSVRFSDRDSLRLHRQYSCLGDKVCDVCGQKGFQNRRKFVQHMRIHDPQFKLDMVRKDTNHFKCDKCHQTFTRQHNLERHRKHVCAHGVICEKCGFDDFQSKMHFNKHMIEHDAAYSVDCSLTGGKQAVMCQLCFRTFDTLSQKDKHVIAVHRKISEKLMFPENAV